MAHLAIKRLTIESGVDQGVRNSTVSGAFAAFRPANSMFFGDGGSERESPRPAGGGLRLARTVLRPEFPVNREKYREIAALVPAIRR
jgi:hypothetical protein